MSSSVTCPPVATSAPGTAESQGVPEATTQTRPVPFSDGFFRDLILSVRNGVVAVDRHGSVALINDVACRILGIPRDSARPGAHFKDILGAGHEFARVLTAAFNLDVLPNRSETRIRRTGKVVGFTVSRIRDRGGRPQGAVVFFKDLTQVEQLEERERLRDRLATLGEMAAAIAHEVKNPLAGIQVMAGLLKRRLPHSDEDQSVLNDIINEARVANKIVVELLEFVRPINLQLESVSVPEVLHDAVAKLEGPVGVTGVTINIECRDPLPAVRGDRIQLRQVMTNLLVNAVEALEGHGRVVIGTRLVTNDAESGPDEDRTDDGWVVIDVDDDGPGIAEEMTEKIFGPFFSTKPRGSGLGLAIVKRIVDAHDGRITVSPRPRGGTRFQVTLPVRCRYESSTDRQEATDSHEAPRQHYQATG